MRLTASATKTGLFRLHAPRGIAVVFLVVAYLLSGALHQFLDMDVTSPRGGIVVTMSAPSDVDNSGEGIAVEHHCHGCFSVSVPTPALAVAMIEPQAAVVSEPVLVNSDLSPGIETPPPKKPT